MSPAEEPSLEDRELSPRWHLRVVAIVIVLLGVAYAIAVRTILK